MTTLFYDYLTSPCGLLRIEANDNGVSAIKFVDDIQQPACSNTHTEQAKKQLQEYFDGARLVFELSLNPTGTVFQQQVWQALLTIPYGGTGTYGDIAKQIGNPKAVRAVGAANGKNPLSIVIPCHRIIGKNGTLTGYAGGLPRKEMLLDLEKRIVGAN